MKDLKLPSQVRIFDTTLRDGEQTPGVALTPDEKIRIAQQLDVLGVDIIEAGFPITSSGEANAVKKIANLGLHAEICALARSVEKDIELAALCEVDTIHTFIATSRIHMEKKLRMSEDEVVDKAVRGVELAKSYGVKVEFSAEDATRSDIKFLKRVYKAVVEAGADRIDIPDTVGFATPHAMRILVKEVREVVNVPIAVHCHDDMGLAVANSIGGVEGGATEIHATINGIGERAGNASLEEVVIALKYLYGIRTNINFRELYKTSRLVASLTGITVPPNKAIVGDNAFAHESGIHTHGVVSSPQTYEPISPEEVGARRVFVAGKHAGTHGIEKQLSDLGYVLTKEQLKEVIKRVKNLGDKGKKVTDVDLARIAESIIGAGTEQKVKLKELVVVSGLNVTPTASLHLEIEGKEYKIADYGVGPIDASIRAIKQVMGGRLHFKLEDFRLEAITGGTDALAEVLVRLSDDQGNVVSSRGVSEDIVLAGVYAVVNAANRLLQKRERE